MLVSAGRLTQAQLARAQRVHDKLEGKRSIESVLVDCGALYRRDLRAVYLQNSWQVPLGMILLDHDAVNVETLDEALHKQAKGDKRRLGALLVEAGLNPRSLLQALGEQRSLPVLSHCRELVDSALLQRVPLSVRECRAFCPLVETKEYVCVMFAEPPDPSLVQEAERYFGKRVRPALAAQETISSVQHATERHKTEALSVRLFDHLLTHAIEVNASDLHIEPMSDRLRVRVRVDGELEPYADWPQEVAGELIARAKVLASCDLAEHRRHQDGRFSRRIRDEEVDCRVSVYASMHGENVVLRLLRRTTGVLRLEELGMAPEVQRRFESEILSAPTGVVLVTGPTGAGKTSTLYSSVAHSNRPNLKVITVEDPIEFSIDGIIQCQVNLKLGQSFADALRAIVRQDPDIIVLGEIRDQASADAAIQAALTGHKVYSTLHTEDSIGGLLRLQEMDIETFLISSTVISVIAQRLLRRICAECSEPKTPNPNQLKLAGLKEEHLVGAQLRHGKGCAHCRHTGYKGRIGVYELLVVNDQIKQALVNRAPASQVRELAMHSAGLVTLQESALALVGLGITTIDEVLANVPRHPMRHTLSQLASVLGYEGRA